MGKRSQVSKGHTVAKTVKTTIPIEIVKELGIEIGDTLDWEIIEMKGKKGVFVRKLE